MRQNYTRIFWDIGKTMKKSKNVVMINLKIEAIFARDGGNSDLEKAKEEAMGHGTVLFLTQMCLYGYSL